MNREQNFFLHLFFERNMKGCANSARVRGMKVIERIMDIQDDTLFMAFDNEVGHSVTKHVCDREQMIDNLRIRKKKKFNSNDEIVKESRFYSRSEAIWTIRDVVMKRRKSIEKWVDTNIDDKLELVFDYERPIGEGVAYGMDWHDPYECSRAIVILKRDPRYLFIVLTAYPEPSYIEMDEMYDRMDAYKERFEKA